MRKFIITMLTMGIVLLPLAQVKAETSYKVEVQDKTPSPTEIDISLVNACQAVYGFIIRITMTTYIIGQMSGIQDRHMKNIIEIGSQAEAKYKFMEDLITAIVKSKEKEESVRIFELGNQVFTAISQQLTTNYIVATNNGRDTATDFIEVLIDDSGKCFGTLMPVIDKYNVKPEQPKQPSKKRPS